MFRRDVERPDIQAFAYTGFGSLSGAAYLFLRVVDAPSARGFLGGLRIASIEDLEQAKLAEATQCAMTAAGLRALGVDESVVRQFNPEFVEGMAGNPNRSLRLGDIGANAPDKWTWGVGDREPHALLMLFARPERIGDLVRETREAAERSGFSAIEALPTDGHGRYRAVRLRRRDLAAGIRLGRSAHARDEGRSCVHQSNRPRRDPPRLLQRIRLPSGLAKAHAGRSERCATEPVRRAPGR